MVDNMVFPIISQKEYSKKSFLGIIKNYFGGSYKEAVSFSRRKTDVSGRFRVIIKRGKITSYGFSNDLYYKIFWFVRGFIHLLFYLFER